MAEPNVVNNPEVTTPQNQNQNVVPPVIPSPPDDNKSVQNPEDARIPRSRLNEEIQKKKEAESRAELAEADNERLRLQTESQNEPKRDLNQSTQVFTMDEFLSNYEKNSDMMTRKDLENVKDMTVEIVSPAIGAMEDKLSNIVAENNKLKFAKTHKDFDKYEGMIDKELDKLTSQQKSNPQIISNLYHYAIGVERMKNIDSPNVDVNKQIVNQDPNVPVVEPYSVSAPQAQFGLNSEQKEEVDRILSNNSTLTEQEATEMVVRRYEKKKK